MKYLIIVKSILWASVVTGLFGSKAWAQCQNIPQFYIIQLQGCEDNQIVLEAVTEAEFSGWSVHSGSENSIADKDSKITEVMPESTTIYKASVRTNQEEDLIDNGNFDEGFIGFTTDFIYTDTVNTQGVFTLNTSSEDSAFVHKEDHTTGEGKMFIADGSKFSEKAIYRINVSLEKGMVYTFSFWMANNHKDFLLDTDTDSRISVHPSIHLDGEMVYNELLPDDTSWTKIEYTWTENTGGNRTIEIKNLTTTKKGNDFVLDDVSLTYSCTQTQEIEIEPCNTDDTFSPDNDGWKDTYFIEETGIAKIYDVNGTEIEQLSVPAYWDGSDKYGNVLPGGFYVIIINENVVHRVTLVR